MQKKYFHGGEKDSIVIEDNLFETFDKPLLYAKSCDGIIFRNNTIRKTTDFPAFHGNKHGFFFERVKNITIENNDFYQGFQLDKEIRLNLTEPKEISVKEKK